MYMRFQDIPDHLLDDIFEIVEKKEREIKQEFYRKNAFKRCMDDLLNGLPSYEDAMYAMMMTPKQYDIWIKIHKKSLIIHRRGLVLKELKIYS